MAKPFANIAAQTSGRAGARNFYDALAGRPLDPKSEYGSALLGIEKIERLGQGISLVQVDCAETATMRAWNLGAEVLKDVTLIPYSCCYSVIRDPAGARVVLFQPTSKNGKNRNCQ